MLQMTRDLAEKNFVQKHFHDVSVDLSKFDSFMYNVEKWPNILQDLAVIIPLRLLKHVWQFSTLLMKRLTGKKFFKIVLIKNNY